MSAVRRGHPACLRRMAAGAFALALTVMLGACGGGGGSGGGTTSGTTSSAPAPGASVAAVSNIVPVTIAQLPNAGNVSTANIPYVTVTVCDAGGACASIPNVLVDTGSAGLRLFANKVSGVSLPMVAGATSGSTLGSCGQFASGYLWGSVRLATVHIGSIATTAAIPVTLINDPQQAPVPTGCSGQGPDFSTLLSGTTNGILGISNFPQDCGAACVRSAGSGFYFSCAAGSCAATTVPLGSQVANPVASFPAGVNNGTVLTLPAVASVLGAPSASGTLAFGVNTQADNALPAGAQTFALDSKGNFGVALAGGSGAGFIDSGSNGYFLALNLPLCSNGFYCPTTTTNEALQFASGNVTGSGSIQIGNATSMFSTGNAALPAIGGTEAIAGQIDLGLPFFYGRSIATGLPVAGYASGFVAF